MKFFVLIFLGWYFLWGNVFGQNTGYLGNKNILKIELLDGVNLSFTSVEFERVVSRKWSVFAGLSHFNRRNVYSRHVGNYQEFDALSTIRYRIIHQFRGGKTRGFMGYVGGRHYFGEIMPAPIGFYTDMYLGVGHANHTGYMVTHSAESIIPGGNYTKPDTVYPNQNGKGLFSVISFPSLGVQVPVGQKLLLDFVLASQFYFHKPDFTIAETYSYNDLVTPNLAWVSGHSLAWGGSFKARLSFALF